jgi:phosphonoacetate hydrolase
VEGRVGIVVVAGETRAQAGARVVSITAKDKLRKQLAKGLDCSGGRHVSFSTEFVERCTLAENGIENVLEFMGMEKPGMYSMELSLFVLEAGLKLLQERRPELLYLSLTDWVQHKWAPEEEDARTFYRKLDDVFGRLAAQDVTLALTADHGMNDKHHADKTPSVVYLEPLFESWLGKGQARVILPITDPYVVHHGALGSFATAYLPSEIDVPALLARLQAMPGIEAALDRATACARFELPADRMGDIVVVSTRHKVIGTSLARHDLSGLKEPLRSHGGISEQRVPLLFNRKVALEPGRRYRNFDIFDLVLNRIQERAAA